MFGGRSGPGEFSGVYENVGGIIKREKGLGGLVQFQRESGKLVKKVC